MDSEIIFTKGEVYTHRSLETGAWLTKQGHMGKEQGWSAVRGQRGEYDPEPNLFLFFPGRNGQGKIGRYTKFRIA